MTQSNWEKAHHPCPPDYGTMSQLHNLILFNSVDGSSVLFVDKHFWIGSAVKSVWTVENQPNSLSVIPHH